MTESKPSLALADVARIARQAVSDQAVRHEVVGVSVSGDGSNYVEILITIDHPHTGGALVVIGAFRDVAETALLREIRSRLQLRQSQR
jgi:hypothetical protein